MAWNTASFQQNDFHIRSAHSEIESLSGEGQLEGGMDVTRVQSSLAKPGNVQFL